MLLNSIDYRVSILKLKGMKKILIAIVLSFSPIICFAINRHYSVFVKDSMDAYVFSVVRLADSSAPLFVL